MPTRDDIVAALEARLKSISSDPAGGYNTDAGNHVYSWLEYLLAPTGFPMLIWRDGPRVVSDNEEYSPSLGQEAHELDIVIEGVTQTGEDIEELRLLLADLRKAIGSDPYFGGLAVAADRWVDDWTVEESEQGLLGFVKVTFTLIYWADAWGD